MTSAQGRPTVALLDHDPALGGALDPARLAAARRAARATAVTLPRGRWDAAALAARCPLGALLLAGVVGREATLETTRSLQLLGRGDLLVPTAALGEALVDVDVAWHVLEPATLALLDERFLLTVRRWPELVAALFQRLAAQVARSGTQRAIGQLPRVEQRVRVLLWFLAERWGRVTPDGVVLPLALTHALLGRLVGARRPTVTLALRVLAADGAVRRRPDGTWLLRGAPAPAVAAVAVSRGTAAPGGRRRSAPGTRPAPPAARR